MRGGQGCDRRASGVPIHPGRETCQNSILAELARARFRGGPHSTGEQDEVQHSCDQQCRIGDMKDAWNAWGRLFSSRLLEKRQLNSNVLDLTLNLSMKSLFNLNSALYMAPRNARLRT